MADDNELREFLGSFTHAEEKKILEERAEAWSKLQEITTRSKDGMSAEDDAAYVKGERDIDELTTRLERGLRLRAAQMTDAERRGAREEQTGTPEERYNEVFTKFLRKGVNELNHDERSVIELRVQNTLTGAAGGFAVPDGFWNRLVEAQKAYGPIENLVNVITTQTGNDIPWLTEDSTTQEGELLNEGDQVSNLDIALGVKMLRAFTYSSKMVLISWQLLQDAVIDIEGLVARVAGKRLSRIHNRHFTVGTGVNQPEGITVGLSGGKAFAGATAITVDELIDIQHILDPAYRGGQQRWMFNDATLKIIRKLADINGNKIWQPGLQAGIPDTILGDPYSINQSMPAPTSGNVSVLYGDFSTGYIIRRVKGATAVRLSEKYADFLQTGFFVYDRMDGKKDDTNAYTYGVQA